MEGLFVFASFSIAEHLDDLATRIFEVSRNFETRFDHIFLYIDSLRLIYHLALPSMKWDVQEVDRCQYNEKLSRLDRGD